MVRKFEKDLKIALRLVLNWELKECERIVKFRTL